LAIFRARRSEIIEKPVPLRKERQGGGRVDGNFSKDQNRIDRKGGVTSGRSAAGVINQTEYLHLPASERKKKMRFLPALHSRRKDRQEGERARSIFRGAFLQEMRKKGIATAALRSRSCFRSRALERKNGAPGKYIQSRTPRRTRLRDGSSSREGKANRRGKSGFREARRSLHEKTGTRRNLCDRRGTFAKSVKERKTSKQLLKGYDTKDKEHQVRASFGRKKKRATRPLRLARGRRNTLEARRGDRPERLSEKWRVLRGTLTLQRKGRCEEALKGRVYLE